MVDSFYIEYEGMVLVVDFVFLVVEVIMGEDVYVFEFWKEFFEDIFMFKRGSRVVVVEGMVVGRDDFIFGF